MDGRRRSDRTKGATSTRGEITLCYYWVHCINKGNLFYSIYYIRLKKFGGEGSIIFLVEGLNKHYFQLISSECIPRD